MRLFVSGLRKLSRRLATYLTFGLLAGLLALIIVAVAASGGRGQNGNGPANPLAIVTFPGAYDLILSFILGLGGLFSVVYGAAIAGSEWTWGTLKTVVARGESRSRYVLATFAAIAVVALLGLLASFGIGVVAAAIGATIANIPLDGIGNGDALGRLPEHFLRGWVAIVMEGSIGFAIATLARSQLAGIGAGIAFYFGESFASLFLPDVVKYLPFNLANAAVGSGGGFGGGGGGGGGAPAATTPLSADLALLLVAAWLVGSLVVAAGFTERAEITG
jgi:ABC-type transport system involved in multi-copper enzyme maturation permease subunit